MFDGVLRRAIVPVLDRIGARLAARGAHADSVSLLGAALAIVCGMMIAMGWWWTGLALLAASRLCDGLDGAIARHSGLSDFGGYLDICCDFVFYAAVPIGFAVSDPAKATAAAVLLGSFYINGASFLGYAILAAKRGMTTEARGKKSLYFTTGLAEGSETIAVFVAMLLWPAAFVWLAYAFALLCLITCLARLLNARVVFGENPPQSL